MFDALHEWFGIPPDEQPPNHYGLLRLPLLESDPQVINKAADAMLQFLHHQANGEHADAAEKCANQVSLARLTLANPTKKLAYDQSLRDQPTSSANSVPAAPVPAAPVAVPAAPAGSGEQPLWSLRHADLAVHGPFTIDSLADASKEGRISPETEVRHPVITRDDWVKATSIPAVAMYFPVSQERAVPAADSPSAAVPTGPRQPHGRSPRAADSKASSTDAAGRPAGTRRQQPTTAAGPKIRPKRVVRRGNAFLQIAAMVAPGIVLTVATAYLIKNPGERERLLGLMGKEPAATAEVEPPPQPRNQPAARPRPRPRVTVGRAEPQISTASSAAPAAFPVAAKPPNMTVTARPSATPTPAAVATVKREFIPLDLSLELSHWVRRLTPKSPEPVEKFVVTDVARCPTMFVMVPASGELSFDRDLRISFANMSDLTLKLRLARVSKGESLSLTGEFEYTSDDGGRRLPFSIARMNNYANLMTKQFLAAKRNYQQLTAEHTQLTVFLDSNGTKRLTAVNAAENRIKFLEPQIKTLDAGIRRAEALAASFRTFKENVMTFDEDSKVIVHCVRAGEDDPTEALPQAQQPPARLFFDN